MTLTRTVMWVLSVGLSVGCGTGRRSQWEGPATPAQPGMPSPGAAPAAAGGGTDALAAEAEAAWAERGARARLETAIARWESVAVVRPADAVTLARLSRALYFLAEAFLRTDAQSYLATLERGTAAGERALGAASPAFRAKVKADEKVEEAIAVVGREGLEAMYWYAVNLGKWARAKGLAALLGNKDRVQGVMARALELDEGFFHGAPHRYFGAYWALLPVGRDLDKSRQHFERSLAIAPRYVGTKVLMAETYAVKKQDRALFRKLLDEALATPDDAIPDLVAETRVEKDKARELGAKIDELF